VSGCRSDTLADDAAALRDWLIARTPDLLHGLIATAPLWALGLLVVVVGLAAVWAVVQPFESGLLPRRPFLIDPMDEFCEYPMTKLNASFAPRPTTVS
jgi:hypothetical protein